jgi:hypothetical protein
MVSVWAGWLSLDRAEGLKGCPESCWILSIGTAVDKTFIINIVDVYELDDSVSKCDSNSLADIFAQSSDNRFGGHLPSVFARTAQNRLVSPVPAVDWLMGSTSTRSPTFRFAALGWFAATKTFRPSASSTVHYPFSRRTTFPVRWCSAMRECASGSAAFAIATTVVVENRAHVRSRQVDVARSE